MTEDTIDCYNCGRENPEWAQVCRSCGVALKQGEARVVPGERIPTDRNSLISIGSVLGTILVAVLVGLFVSGLNPTEPTVGRVSPTPIPTLEPTVEPSPSLEPEPTVEPTPTPVPTPALPGTLAFGTSLGENGQVAEPVDTFTPSQAFAYSVTVPGGLGAPTISNEIAKIGEDGEQIVLPRQNVGVNPESETFGYVIGNAAGFLGQWGPGEFEWRTYVGENLVARGRFRYAEG